MATNASEELSLARLRTLPLRLLRPSALVDFVLLLVCGKPAIRLVIDTEIGLESLKIWCLKSDFDFAADNDSFACIAVEAGFASHVLEIDQNSESHETELGRALGYPLCCCERVAFVGESKIDEYAAEVARWSFDGRYHRINPSGYRSGRALISHLPCSPFCDASLAIADRMHKFVMAYASEPILTELYCSPVVST